MKVAMTRGSPPGRSIETSLVPALTVVLADGARILRKEDDWRNNRG
jgi:hypothetical protein